MKRYLFSISAVLVAAGTFAFKAAADKPINSFFEFDYAHNLPTLNNVQDEAKWVKVSDLGTCNSNMIKACRIEVAPTYVSGSTLLPTATIAASESSTNVAYVVSGNIAQIRNKN